MYLTDHIAISPQETFSETPLINGVEHYTDLKLPAKEPAYDFIPVPLLRKMGKAVRMGVGAGIHLLNRHPHIDGIITASANGGLGSCVRFLDQIIRFEEGRLTPTHFVQGTPNAVGGTLAQMSENGGYNLTHVGRGLAFESALVDALMLFEEERVQRLLIGASEELTDYNYRIQELTGAWKTQPVPSGELLSSHSPWFGEW